MYAIERLLEVGFPIIIEGNFAPVGLKKVDETAVIKSLIEKYNYEPLTYLIKNWLLGFNRSFALPSEKQAGEIRELIYSLQEALPSDIVRELLFMIPEYK